MVASITTESVIAGSADPGAMTWPDNAEEKMMMSRPALALALLMASRKVTWPSLPSTSSPGPVTVKVDSILRSSKGSSSRRRARESSIDSRRWRARPPRSRFSQEVRFMINPLHLPMV